MDTIKLEMDKAMLAREILNSDNSEMIAGMKRAYLRLSRQYMKNDEQVEKDESLPASKEEILASIKSGLREARKEHHGIHTGMFRPIEDLFAELESEEE